MKYRKVKAGSLHAPPCRQNLDPVDTVAYTWDGEAGTPIDPSPQPEIPDARFIAWPLYGQAPLTVEFADLSTGIPNHWEWDFDNSGVVDSTDPRPTHTFVTNGRYSVKLTVSNSKGQDTEFKEYLILVEDPPPPPPPPLLFYYSQPPPLHAAVPSPVVALYTVMYTDPINITPDVQYHTPD